MSDTTKLILSGIGLVFFGAFLASSGAGFVGGIFLLGALIVFCRLLFVDSDKKKLENIPKLKKTIKEKNSVRILKSTKELTEVLQGEDLFHPEQSLSKFNIGKFYKCGCGDVHEVSKAGIIAACRGISFAHSNPGKGFILSCDEFATLVVTEGTLNYTFRSIWSIPLYLVKVENLKP